MSKLDIICEIGKEPINAYQTVTIATLPSEDSQYAIGQTSLTMTVREAVALRSFLNDNLDVPAETTID